MRDENIMKVGMTELNKKHIYIHNHSKRLKHLTVEKIMKIITLDNIQCQLLAFYIY